MDIVHKPSAHYIIDAIAAVKHYVLAIAAFLALAYSMYLIFPLDTIRPLVREDNIVEDVTAAFFFVAAIIFLRAFLLQRNFFLLLLFIIFFIGAGEEISWGQRILGFTTPALIAENNVQGELTLHNMELFSGSDLDGEHKTGVARLLEINFLYKLFWLGYGVLLPIAVLFVRPISTLVQKINVPVPPLAIGIFFFINWCIFRISLSYLLTPVEGDLEAYQIGEVREGCSAFIFMILALYFLNTNRAAYALPSQAPRHSVLE